MIPIPSIKHHIRNQKNIVNFAMFHSVTISFLIFIIYMILITTTPLKIKKQTIEANNAKTPIHNSVLSRFLKE